MDNLAKAKPPMFGVSHGPTAKGLSPLAKSPWTTQQQLCPAISEISRTAAEHADMINVGSGQHYVTSTFSGVENVRKILTHSGHASNRGDLK